MNIRLAQHEDKQLWNEYVVSHPHGLAYHRFAWKEAVERAYRFACPYLLAEEGGAVRGVLPLVHLKPPALGGTLVSLPYCDVGGVLADGPEAEGALLDRARSLAGKLGARAVELREAVPGPGSLPGGPGADRIGGKVRMVLDLPGSSEALLAGFKSKHRSQVRKPERDGLTPRLGGGELLDPFYRVFAENMRDLGSPVHSRRWVESVVSAYGEDCRVGVVQLPDGTPAAGGVILLHPGVVSIPWASALREWNRYNPNMLLYWSFLAFAADSGFPRFDFGRSTPGEGTFRFKEQWGARPEPLRWRRVTPEGGTAELGGADAPGGLGRRSAEAVIRRLPVFLASCLGAAVRKYVSL